VPDDAAQNVADNLIESGIKGIWNFTNVPINAPKEISVVNENLMVGLSVLSFYLNQNSN
jgi:redox-sensing transcriptional repressor